MTAIIIGILKILGALAFFIYGMKVMSEGIQRAAGSQMRLILRGMTRNRVIGVVSGAVITALVQSSSATTLMTVSFVNAGLLSLSEAAGLMIGANIGTTATGWLVALEISKLQLADLVLPFMVLGLPLLFIKRGRIRFWGEFIVGIVLLVLGLNFLKEAVPDLSDQPEALQFLSQFTHYGFLTTLFFIIVGIVLTISVQSSSAALVLTLVVCANRWVSYENAAAIIIGANIGTTLTAEVAALVSNVYARRSARIHTLFNLIGALWMMLLIPFCLKWIDQIFLQNIFGASAYTDAAYVPLGLAAFHMCFNVITALLLVGFIPLLTKMATRLVRSRDGEEAHFQLNYIDFLVKTPELSILEVQKEVGRYGEITSRMATFARDILFAIDKKEQRNLRERIAKYEAITDRVEIEVTEYLTKVAREKLSTQMAIRVRSIMSICGDLEKIGDNFYQFSTIISQKNADKIWFNQHQRTRLKELLDLIDEAFVVMVQNLKNPHYEQVQKNRAVLLYERIQNLASTLERENADHIKSKEEYNIPSALIYSNLISILRKTGVHITNVSESIVGEI